MHNNCTLGAVAVYGGGDDVLAGADYDACGEHLAEGYAFHPVLRYGAAVPQEPFPFRLS